MHCLSRYEALGKFREHGQIKSQNDRPSPEIPHRSRAISRVPARVCDFEGGAVCSKNSKFGYSNPGNSNSKEKRKKFELTRVRVIGVDSKIEFSMLNIDSNRFFSTSDSV